MERQKLKKGILADFVATFVFGFVLVTLPSSLAAQNRTNIWYFGVKAGLDFNSGSPVPLTDGELTSFEGSAVMCDLNGDLLFYTDGLRVWNRNHVIMTNGSGLAGSATATQSSLIIPHPGNPNQYFLFTNFYLDSGPLAYSIIDMSLSGGLGAVTATKNVTLFSNSTERLTACKHANGTDVWILAQRASSQSFYAYRVTPGGLITSPVITNVGAFQQGGQQARGQMKLSPDGKKLVVCRLGGVLVEFFDFDNATGRPSNPRQGPLPGYGVEFSHDSKYFYLIGQAQGGYQLLQFPADAANPWNNGVPASAVIPLTGIFGPGQLQLAPDRKIYVAEADDSISVINNPTAPGLACDYRSKVIGLNGRSGQIGLPNFNASEFHVPLEISAEDFCLGSPTLFSFVDSTARDSVLWNFGDPATGPLNESTLISPSHVFSDTGTYAVQLVGWIGGIPDTAFYILNIAGIPSFSLGNDTTLCLGGVLTLRPDNPSLSYVWSDGSTGDSLNVTQAGIYWAEVSDSCGTVRDSVEVLPFLSVDLGQDTTLCVGQSLVLDAGQAAGTYLWSDNSTGSTLTVTVPGWYWVEIVNGSCTFRDSIQVFYLDLPAVSLGNDTTICNGTSLILDGDPTGSNQGTGYLWGPGGQMTSQIVVNTAGTYSVSATNFCGTVQDQIIVELEDFPVVDLGSDAFLCPGDSLILDAGNPGDAYLWSTGATTSTIVVGNQSANYSVSVSNLCGTSSASMNVTAQQVPTVDLGTDIEVCAGTEVLLDASNPWAVAYNWNNGSADAILDVLVDGTYIVEALGNCGLATDTLSVSFWDNPEPRIGPDTTICERYSLLLSPDQAYSSYTWSTGATGAQIEVAESGSYSLVVTNDNGCTGSASMYLYTEQCDAAIYVPNSFTPNGDNLNDDFFPVENRAQVTYFAIFNRYGQLIHQGNGVSEVWDGTYKGAAAQEGVYVWKLEFVGEFGERGGMSGTVTLIR